MNPIVASVRRPSPAVRASLAHLSRGHVRIAPQWAPFSTPALRPSSVCAATTSNPNRMSIASFRIATRSLSSMTSELQPQFAEGIDAEPLRPQVDALVGNGWKLDEDGMGVLKTYYFKTYFKAVTFANVVASQSASQKHHPTMTVRIGSVDIHWTTHHPRGLTEKDLSMAEHCDEAAEMMGAVEQVNGKKCG